jgi:hypothetical protein
MAGDTTSAMIPDLDGAWLVTDRMGQVCGVSAQAEELLRTTRRGLLTRSLLLFLARDRVEWAKLVYRLRPGERIERDVVVKPREGRPVRIVLTVLCEHENRVGWVLARKAAPAANRVRTLTALVPPTDRCSSSESTQ